MEGPLWNEAGGDAFQFMPGVVAQAGGDGHWLLLDELHLAPAEVLTELETILDSGGFKVTAITSPRCIKRKTTSLREAWQSTRARKEAIAACPWKGSRRPV